MTTTPEQIEAVARAIYSTLEGPIADQNFGRQKRQWEMAIVLADAAINAMRPFIRAEALEEAANIIERLTYRKRFIYAKQNNQPIAPCEYAAAIRALKDI